MERVLTLVAALVALCVAVLMPAVVAYSSYQSQRSILQTEAEINARLLSQVVSANPDLWPAMTIRFESLLSKRPLDGTPESRALLSVGGDVVAEVNDALEAPLIEQLAPVYDAGHAVANLRIRRSLRPVLLQNAWMGLLGLLLAGGTYATLKLIPLRALRRAQQRLVHEATHDALTGLPNRVMFRERLDEAMERARRTRRSMALMFMDLDQFKDINDSMGHEAGDHVLRHVADLLRHCLAGAPGPARRRGDGMFTIARLGGDEFTVILESAGTIADISKLAEGILAALRRPLRLEGRDLVLSGSLGISLYPQDHTDRDTLLRQADMAMYRAKDLGRGTFHFFNEDLDRAIQQRIELDRRLHGALERSEFILHYQPKADLTSGAVTGVEALLRWNCPGKGLVPPVDFIHVLEESRLIVPVGAWVIHEACEQLARWDRAGLPPLTMAVNLSARQFRDPALTQHIEQALRASGIAPERLELELTETLLMEDNELSRELLVALAHIGVRVAIDDFGTGHSSLAYLKRFRVDTLKLDRTFVRDLPRDADNCAIATAVTALAHSMNLAVVCEGVETAEQLEFLRTLGCESVQGYALSRPMPSADLQSWMQRYIAGDPDLHAWHSSLGKVSSIHSVRSSKRTMHEVRHGVA